MGRERTGGTFRRAGRLYARVTYVDDTGRRREVTRRAIDQADAQRIIAELHERIDSHGGEAAANDRSTLREVIELYRAEKAGPAVIQGGKKIAGLKSSYNHGFMLDTLVEYLGHKKLRDLRPVDIQAFKRKRLSTPTQYGKQRSIAAVNRELEALRTICRWCVNQGWLSRSPFGAVVINKSHEASRDRVLSHDEEQALLAACTGKREFLRAVVIVAVDSAMRLGEILKLTWGMVNLAQAVINLPETITKTGKPRTVPLTPRVLEALRDKHAKERQKGGTGGKLLKENFPEAERGQARDHAAKTDDLVFGVSDIKYAWQAACKTAQITGVRFHDLRHTAITRMIAAGVESTLVMRISGHDSQRTFLRYLNPENYTLREVAEKLHGLNVGGLQK